MPVKFYVDPETNSADPDIRIGLHVVSPWGGTVFINFPEHLENMPGTRGIARHHDRRDNVWHVEQSGARGLLIFGRGSLQNAIGECAAFAERPWEN